MHPRRPLQSALRLVTEDASISVADQALVSGGIFLSNVLIARYLGPESFGVVILANLIVALAIALQNGLTLQPLVILGSTLDDAAFRRFLRAHLPVQIIFILCGSLVVAVICATWAPLHGLVWPVSANVLFSQTQEFCRRVLYTRVRMRSALVNNLMTYDLQILPLAVMGMLGALTLETALWVVAGTSLLGCIIGLFQVRSFWTTESDPIGTTFKRVLRIGQWTAASVVVGSAGTQGYPFILAAFGDIAAAAGMGVLRQVVGPLQLITRAVDNYYLPRATRALAAGGTPALTRVLREAAMLSGPVLILYPLTLTVLPELTLRTVFGELYVQYAPALRLFALGSLIYVPVYAFKLELNARQKQRLMFLMEVWTVVIVYGVGLKLISAMSLVGAAMASLVVLSSQVLFYAVMLGRLRLAESAGRSRESVLSEAATTGAPREQRASALLPTHENMLRLAGRGQVCFVPMSSLRVRLSGTRMYRRYRRSAEVYRAGLRAWIALGGARLTHPILPKCGGRRDWQLGELLRDDLPTLSTAAVVAGTRIGGNATAQLMDTAGCTLAYAKLAVTPMGCALLANEARVLQELPAGLGPRLTRLADFAGGTLLVQTPLPGRPYRPLVALDDAQWRFLARLARPRDALPAEDHPFIARLRTRLGDTWQRRMLDRIVDELGDWDWPIVWVHGDFSFLNVHRWGSECVAFDWEFGTDEGFPYLDAAHWLCSANFIGRQTPWTAREQMIAALRPRLPAAQIDCAPALAALSVLHALVGWYPPEVETMGEVWEETQGHQEWLKSLLNTW